MRKRSKKKFLWRILAVAAGVLIIGAPVSVCVVEKDSNVLKDSADDAADNVMDNAEDHIIDNVIDGVYGFYTIMGRTTVNKNDMVSLFNSRDVGYPSLILGEGGAGTIEEFCDIILEEARGEGVRGEVVFVQSMLETGWLQYGGDSSAEQFNFSGLGTTGNGVPGNFFPDVRTGLRAQVQHLKAYACQENLNQECVDERFGYVVRESAPYVEWLGMQENPYGTGWAAGEGYGYKLRDLLEELKGTE